MKTRIPPNTYSVILKILLLSFLFGYIIENILLAIGLGVLSGLILHVLVSYNDCVVYLNGSILTFYFLRPFLFKETYDLNKLDKVEIIKENKEKTQKDIWWQADMLYQFSYDMMILHKGGLDYKVKFRTNESDLPFLEAEVKKIFERKSTAIKK